MALPVYISGMMFLCVNKYLVVFGFVLTVIISAEGRNHNKALAVRPDTVGKIITRAFTWFATIAVDIIAASALFAGNFI